MIKFFRKIREQMISGPGIAAGRLRNYLIYATGEIILVVIGILIALSINNANQTRIIREKEQTYLGGLQMEFQASKNKLENLIKVNRQNYEGAKKLLTLLDDPSTVPNEQELNVLLFNSLVFDVAYNPNNSLLREMMSSGSLKDITNSRLRVYLTSWESVTERIKIQEAELRKQRQDIVDLIRTGNGSIRTILDQANVTTDVMGMNKRDNAHGNLEIFRSGEFENDVLLYILTSISAEREHYQPLAQEIDEILEIIGEEINK